jgi:hypothetical protein
MKHTITYSLIVFLLSIAINYFVMGLMDVCEVNLKPTKVLVPLGFAVVVSLYIWLRRVNGSASLVSACVVGTLLGATVGRFYPWACF